MADQNTTQPAPEKAPETRKEQTWRPAPHRSRKRVLIILGFAAVVGGAFYAWWAQRDSEESKGWDAYHRGDYPSAIAHFDAALRRNPRSADAYTGRGWARGARGEWQQAIADSTEAIRLDPGIALAYVARANALAETGKVSEALADLDEAIRRDPNCKTAYFHRGRLRSGDPREAAAALADLNETIRLDPEFAAAYLYRGAIRVARGEVAQGEADIERAQRMDPSLRVAKEPSPPRGR
jgi:tetratricopeptide (TPR) repeat protein